jgi:type I restriction enzyme S subunit
VNWLTSDWNISRLGDLAEIAMGQAPPSAETNTDGNGTPFYRSGEFGAERPVTRIWTTKPLRRASSADVLVCVVGANSGAINLGMDGAIGRSVAAITPIADLDQRFLFHFLNSLTSALRLGAQGSAQGVITKKDIAGIEIPLPPVDKQRQIVDLLEDHLSRLDAAVNYLAAVTRRVESFRASALADAYSGQPVALGELTIMSGYGTSEKCVVGGPGPAVVRIPNLVDGSVDLADEKRVADSRADVANRLLDPGDVLIVRTNGSIALIGRSAVVQPGIEAAFASYLIRYRLDTTRVLPEWVQAMLSAPQSRALLERLAASSAGQHNLSLGKLDGVPIPLPTLEEQKSYLRQLADMGDVLSRLTHASQAASRDAADLRRSLLAAAFSGRLTGTTSDVPDVEELIGA